MKLTEILKQDAQGMYHATEGLFRLEDDLEWKPSTGMNWMRTAQLLHHARTPHLGTEHGSLGRPRGNPAPARQSALPE